MVVRLLLVQYAGDYRETVKRFAQGGAETYYAQKYSVEAVAELAQRFDEVATLCCMTEEPYNEMLENGVRAIGAGFNTQSKRLDSKTLIALIAAYQPTHLVLRTPLPEILRWAIQHSVKIVATLADSFNAKGLKSKIQIYRLARLLNHHQVDWVANHGINASLSLKNIGVKADKIIPWDWVHTVTPQSFPTKALATHQAVWEIGYVGHVSSAKGVDDLLKALTHLKSQGIAARLRVVGQGDLETYTAWTKQLGIEDAVEFLGLLPNKDIIPLMHQSDVVVIPSRHDYPEGFPMTIYEALCSRTPIIASDHPMFVDKLVDQQNALVFPAGNSAALATSIKTLLSSPHLYQRLSDASYDAWMSIQIPVKWADLINLWISGLPEDRQKLASYRLSSGRYKIS